MAEGAPLLREYSSKGNRGFESHRLRQKAKARLGLSCFLHGFGSEPPAWLALRFEAASLRASRRENPADSAVFYAAENIVEIRLWRDPPPAGSHREYSIRHAGS